MTAAVALAALMASPEIALAADIGPCANPNAQNSFLGYGKVLSGPSGVEAVLENQALNICTSSTDNNRANHVWVAIDDNSSHSDDIIQVGLVHCVDNTNSDCTNFGTHEFWAWGRDPTAPGCGSLSHVLPIPRAITGFPAASYPYTVVKTSTQYQFKVNATVQETLLLTSICWTRNRVEWSGESWDPADAIGGTSGNPFHVSSAIYELATGGAWSNSNWGTGAVCNAAPTHSWYHCNAPTSTSMDLWTVQP
ncbi:MAG: hypothetical protein HY263_12210 [Chloroflexi bacterium]|nr:hypothetical protein [Chloroflexota bacterium]